jgi:hypothetical protein
MTFRVGQRVVCVDDAFHPRGTAALVHGRSYLLSGKSHGLTRGSVYTVRSLAVAHDGGPAIHLEEIIRSPAHPVLGEIPYRASRFRPVKETDISIFTAMLSPTPKQKQRVTTER